MARRSPGADGKTNSVVIVECVDPHNLVGMAFREPNIAIRPDGDPVGEVEKCGNKKTSDLAGSGHPRNPEESIDCVNLCEPQIAVGRPCGDLERAKVKR